MEVDHPPSTSNNTGLATTTSSSSNGLLNVILHPLVIINISDHWTRTKAQLQQQQQASQKTEQVKVFGALLGTQQGRDIEIHNSFEVKVNPSQETHQSSFSMVIDEQFLNFKKDQYKQVFPAFDVLGWYGLGNLPTASDIEIHKQFLAQNENALFLQLNYNLSASNNINSSKVQEQLPVTVYESKLDLQGSKTQHNMIFHPIKYRVETGDAERIAVTHVATNASKNDESEEMKSISILLNERNAILSLQKRLDVLDQYLVQVKEGKHAFNHDLIRRISSVLHRASYRQSNILTKEFEKETHDVLVAQQLLTVTSSLDHVYDLIDKLNTIMDKGRSKNLSHNYHHHRK